MQALILAGGFGTRLRPLTLNKPKPVVSLVNRPILSYQLELLRRAGIYDVILSLNYQPTVIQEIIGDGSDYGVKIRYVVEPEPMGTAGAVKYAGEFINEPVVILNGDNLINLNVTDVMRQHQETKAKATIVLETVENPSNYGLVEIDAEKRVLNFLEKPKEEDLHHIKTRTVNAGTYVLEPEVLELIPTDENYSFEYGVFPELLSRRENFFAYVTDSYWLDVGTPARYLQAHLDIINNRVVGFDVADERGSSNIALTTELSDNSHIGKHCLIENASNIRNSVLGDNIFVGKNSSIENSVIAPNTKIGDNVNIFGAIIGESCVIGDYSQIGSGAMLGDGSVLTEYSKV